MKKRILTLLAAVCLLSAVLSGCGGGSQTGTAGNTEQNTAAPAEVVSASNSTPSEGSPISINFAPVYNFSGVSDTQQFESLLTSRDDDMREYILGVVEEAEHDKFRRAYA